MGTNKHAQIRYLALDRAFGNFGRFFFIEDLVEICNAAIYDYSGKWEAVKKRQIYLDIVFMQSEQGWGVQLKNGKVGRRVFYRYQDKGYSINQSPISTDEIKQIREVLFTLTKFKGLPQFEWIEEISEKLEMLSKGNTVEMKRFIEFDQNPFMIGLKQIAPLFNAISNKRVINLSYMPFRETNEKQFIVHPFFLKQYNQRWFLFGIDGTSNRISNHALDRIVGFFETGRTCIENTEIDFTSYFDDVVGVTVPLDAQPEKVILKVNNQILPYLVTKPIHGSQKPPKINAQGATVELNLIINYELVAQLLSYGSAVTVLEPEHLVGTFRERIAEMFSNYQE